MQDVLLSLFSFARQLDSHFIVDMPVGFAIAAKVILVC